MRFSPQNQNDRTGAFDIELEGFGRIAHVDPFAADDPNAFRDLLCAAPDMLAVLKAVEGHMMGYVDRLYRDGPRMAGSHADAMSKLNQVRAAIAKAGGGAS